MVQNINLCHYCYLEAHQKIPNLQRLITNRLKNDRVILILVLELPYYAMGLCFHDQCMQSSDANILENLYFELISYCLYILAKTKCCKNSSRLQCQMVLTKCFITFCVVLSLNLQYLLVASIASHTICKHLNS